MVQNNNKEVYVAKDRELLHPWKMKQTKQILTMFSLF